MDFQVELHWKSSPRSENASLPNLNVRNRNRNSNSNSDDDDAQRLRRLYDDDHFERNGLQEFSFWSKILQTINDGNSWGGISAQWFNPLFPSSCPKFISHVWHNSLFYVWHDQGKIKSYSRKISRKILVPFENKLLGMLQMMKAIKTTNGTMIMLSMLITSHLKVFWPIVK